MKKYKTSCYMCEKKLVKDSFNFILGAMACFLCDKCIKKVEKFIEQSET